MGSPFVAAAAAAPIPAPLPRPSLEGVVIVRMSDFEITARPARLRSSRAAGDRRWNWPRIRSPFFSSAVMGDAISKVETFSQRPGITPAVTGCAISPARSKEGGGREHERGLPSHLPPIGDWKVAAPAPAEFG